MNPLLKVWRAEKRTSALFSTSRWGIWNAQFSFARKQETIGYTSPSLFPAVFASRANRMYTSVNRAEVIDKPLTTR